MTMHKIYIEDKTDRMNVAMALIRAGYTVRWGRTRSQNGRSWLNYVEYWRETDGD